MTKEDYMKLPKSDLQNCWWREIDNYQLLFLHAKVC